MASTAPGAGAGVWPTVPTAGAAIAPPTEATDWTVSSVKTSGVPLSNLSCSMLRSLSTSVVTLLSVTVTGLVDASTV